ncbi:MAG TPA: HEAT repeat domain-containing protein [Planctomycetaceae bacterium]|nr:HEAT repeat domain-containing protein [Planctomycetaceae bacterium]HQZ68133.1 HEAT repeat domain-containing protein [Planctomycetaceae bacterium]
MQTNQIRQLVHQLADDDASVRQKSREQLTLLRSLEVTRELVVALIDPRAHVRWEAAKALQAMADPVSAPALMHAMDDENEDVRWVAAEGLIALGRIGLLTVLSGLMKRAGSVAYCSAAHHVLHECKTDVDVVAPVKVALEQLDRAITAPLAAFEALVALHHAPETHEGPADTGFTSSGHQGAT